MQGAASMTRNRTRNLIWTVVGAIVCAGVFVGMSLYSNIDRQAGPPRRDQEFAAVGPQMGPRDAPVQLVEFSNYLCKYCKTAARALEPSLMAAAERGEVSYTYKHMLLNLGPAEMLAAQAAECAGDQGFFWAYGDRLFANQKPWSVAELESFAGDLGLNLPEFRTCLESKKYEAKVLADHREAKQLGVEGTPTFFLNEKRHTGTFGELLDAIRKQLK